ncbi:MAG: hypothetical protein WC741_05085 [Patescibacteria group bacterium]|jgi:hypothetical protein
MKENKFTISNYFKKQQKIWERLPEDYKFQVGSALYALGFECSAIVFNFHLLFFTSAIILLSIVPYSINSYKSASSIKNSKK